MLNNYTWTVTNLIGYPVLDSEYDVVTTAIYTVSASDGEGHTAMISNIPQRIPLPRDRPFVPFTDLTNEIVVGWIQAELGVEGVSGTYATLDAQIRNQINSPSTPVSLPLPWSQTGSPV